LRPLASKVGPLLRQLPFSESRWLGGDVFCDMRHGQAATWALGPGPPVRQCRWSCSSFGLFIGSVHLPAVGGTETLPTTVSPAPPRTGHPRPQTHTFRRHLWHCAAIEHDHATGMLHALQQALRGSSRCCAVRREACEVVLGLALAGGQQRR
jgi:hypothetical protein